MAFCWAEHTAELELQIRAPTERAVFADALRALGELLGDGARARPRERRQLAVSAPDRPALLALWLEELVFLAESEGFVAVALESLELDDANVRATVRGHLCAPPPLVKAVTYHRLDFSAVQGGYRATVVLDV